MVSNGAFRSLLLLLVSKMGQNVPVGVQNMCQMGARSLQKPLRQTSPPLSEPHSLQLIDS